MARRHMQPDDLAGMAFGLEQEDLTHDAREALEIAIDNVSAAQQVHQLCENAGDRLREVESIEEINTRDLRKIADCSQ